MLVGHTTYFLTLPLHNAEKVLKIVNALVECSGSMTTEEDEEERDPFDPLVNYPWLKPWASFRGNREDHVVCCDTDVEPDTSDVSWHTDRVFDTDIRYVREDLQGVRCQK